MLERSDCVGLVKAKELVSSPGPLVLLDDRQITHLICARLKYDLYDFFRGCFGPASFLFLV